VKIVKRNFCLFIGFVLTISLLSGCVKSSLQRNSSLNSKNQTSSIKQSESTLSSSSQATSFQSTVASSSAATSKTTSSKPTLSVTTQSNPTSSESSQPAKFQNKTVLEKQIQEMSTCSALTLNNGTFMTAGKNYVNVYDKNGNKIKGNPFPEMGRIYLFTSLNNNIVAVNSGSFSCVIYQLNTSGEILQQKNFDQSVSSVKQTSDGGYIVCGRKQYQQYVAGSAPYDAYIAKLTSDFSVTWSKLINAGGLDHVDITGDGYVAVGISLTTAPNFVPRVLKVSNSGNIVWDTVCSSLNGLNGGISCQKDGTTYFSGSFGICKVSATGKVTQFFTLEHSLLKNLFVLQDGSLVVTADNYTNVNTQGYIYKISSAGKLLWSKGTADFVTAPTSETVISNPQISSDNSKIYMFCHIAFGVDMTNVEYYETLPTLIAFTLNI
jgi:hypothetical protein